MRILADALALNDAKTCPHKDFDCLKFEYVELGLQFDQVESYFYHYDKVRGPDWIG